MNTKKSEPTTLINRIENLLDEGKPQVALDLIDRSKQENPVIENARGVCLIRLGKFQEANDVLSAIVFPGRMVGVPAGTPIVYQTNLVIAMLKINNIDGALSILRQINDGYRKHQTVVKIDIAIRRWKKSLSLFQKIQLAVGYTPHKPVIIDCAEGQLETK